MSASLPDIDQRRKDTPAERAARGKDARRRAPRSVHAAWEPRPDRPDPVALLEEQAAERAQELVPIRYGRMLVSPGTFYRGGALLMASDLAGTPGSGLRAQLCGDAHLLNFGLFQSPERRLVFDINDFDETLPGPWEWDVKRLVALYRFRDMARKVVGVGSVGTRAWVLLFFGRDSGDPLFLQAKQAQASVLERFVGRSRFRCAGRRVVEGQRLMQAVGDILLGWYNVTGFDGKPYDFYVRQLWDGKGAFNVGAMTEAAWHTYAQMCSWVLARAHARTGDRIAIAAYLGVGDVFDRAVADFAEAYAEQNERDYEALREAVDSGRVTAVSGI